MNEVNGRGRPADAKPPKAIIYCRVASTTAAEKDLILLSQEMRCRAYAVDKGYPVAMVVHDCPASGARFERTGVRAVFQYLAREKAADPHVVIVDDITRLGRGVDVYQDFRRALDAAGATLECRDTGIGPDSRSPRLESAGTLVRKRGPRR